MASSLALLPVHAANLADKEVWNVRRKNAVSVNSDQDFTLAAPKPEVDIPAEESDVPGVDLDLSMQAAAITKPMTPATPVRRAPTARKASHPKSSSVDSSRSEDEGVRVDFDGGLHAAAGTASEEDLSSVREADPWRMQYFETAPRLPGVKVPTEDIDALNWNPQHAWIYNKLEIARSQGLEAGPHGSLPSRFPVFSKPVTNLKGMGIDSGIIHSLEEYRQRMTPGHFWSPVLRGRHISTDIVVVNGEPQWWRHTIAKPRKQGTFDYWTIQANGEPELESRIGEWIRKHLAGYTGMFNVETIGGWIIEAHMRFADQWPDLYGSGWVDSLVHLYENKTWDFDDTNRHDGYSVVLFGPHGRHYDYPPTSLLQEVLAQPEVSSVQITFHRDKPPEQHAAPPGGFRLAIVNAWNLAAGLKARDLLAKFFIGVGRKSPPPKEPAIPQPEHTGSEVLSQILQLGRQPDFAGDFTMGNARALKNPFFGDRPRGLAALRRIIRRKGLVTVVSGPAPSTTEERRKAEYFYGGKVVYAQDPPDPNRGVAFHLPGMADPVSNLNIARATINPHLGYGYLQWVLSNKLTEYRFAEAVQPGIMPKGKSFDEMLAEDRFPPDFETERLLLKAELDALLRAPRELRPEEQSALRTKIETLLGSFFNGVDAVFPEGAFIKNYGEFMTAAYRSQITSFKRNDIKSTDQFLTRLREVLRHGPFAGGLRDPRWHKRFLRHYNMTGAKFLDILISEPDRLLIQRREALAKDSFGNSIEIRVDFIDGEPLRTVNRSNTLEYLGEEREEAARVIREFFARVPRPFQYLSGGADVAKLEDGRWVIIEFNFGNDSGTLAPQVIPIGSNETKSELINHPTPLISKLNRIFRQGAAAQRRFLLSLKREDYAHASSVDDLSMRETALWMRDQYLIEWRKVRTAEAGEATLHALAEIFDGLGPPKVPYYQNLLLGARRYIDRELSRPKPTTTAQLININ